MNENDKISTFSIVSNNILTIYNKGSMEGDRYQ